MFIYVSVMVAVTFVFYVFMILMFRAFYRKVTMGQALIVNTMQRSPRVTLTGGLVLPVIHRGEIMDITMKHVRVELMGAEAARSADGLPIDLKLDFTVKVNAREEDILKVATSFGCERAGDAAAVQAHFERKFAEAARSACAGLDYHTLYRDVAAFRDQVIELIGRDLLGFCLEDVAVDHLAMTPDPANPGPGFSARLALDAAASERLAAALALPEGQELLKRLATESISPQEAAEAALTLALKTR